MGQLNVYVPDPLEMEIRKEAKRLGKSVSSYMAEAAAEKIKPAQWSPEFIQALQGASLALEEPEDLSLQERDGFEWRK